MAQRLETRIGRPPPVLEHRRGPNHNAFEEAVMAPSIIAQPTSARMFPRLFGSGKVVVRPRPSTASPGAAMTAGGKRPGKRKHVSAKKNIPKAVSPAVSPRRGAAALVSARKILDDCVGAACLVDVTLHSLESREVAHPEQDVLRRALKLLWSVHDWLVDSSPDDLDDDDDDDDDDDGEGEP